jgi:general secretion pathway protein D
MGAAVLLALILVGPWMAPPTPAQPPSPPSIPSATPAATPAMSGGNTSGTAADKLILLNFRDSPLDQVLEFVADLQGRTLIKSPGLNATITLKSQTRLSVKEALQAVDTVLAMNNVTLVPMGDKFLKVVQTSAARQEGMALRLTLPEEPLPQADQLVSQVVVLKYIEIAEATPIIQSLLHGYGKIQALERTNSLLITDTTANMRLILEILEYLDQPAEAKVETRIYTIRYAKASEIAGRLNELIADSQAKEDKPRIEQAAAGTQANLPPGIAALRPRAAQAAAGAEGETAAQLAERGIIRGKVKIIADERTNILFVISRSENYVFFDRIVEVLDRPVDPAIAVRVVALEYAKAEEIAGILNEFIGAASQEKGEGAPAGAAAATGEGQAADTRSQALRDFIAKRAEARTQEAAGGAEAASAFGRLSPNTKILADKRTNSLLLMGSKGDLDALFEVIDNLDIMLAQVLIETVIMEINLGKGLESGVDWLQRSVTAYQSEQRGPRGAVQVQRPVYAFGGGSTMIGDPAFKSGDSLLDTADGNSSLGSSALSYYLTFFDLNLDAVIRLAANSRDARILSTPVVLTTDNTEATISVGEQRPVVTSTSVSSVGGQLTSNYEYRDIGIELAVTPRINPQRFVVMEIKQSANNVGGFETIDGNRVPIITKREISAQIAVRSRNTIVLGGLVGTDKSKSRTKVPLLGDIPLLGAFFRSDTRSETRTELLVMITPYVLTTPDEARQETVRLHKNSLSSKTRWHEGWTDSELPQLTEKEMKEILKQRETVENAPMVRDIFPGRPADAEAARESRRIIDLAPGEEMDTNVVREVTLEEPAPLSPPAVETLPAVEDLRAPAPVRGLNEPVPLR